MQFCTRPVRARVDLVPLAERLNAEEAAASDSASWAADAVSALTPVLALEDGAESSLAASAVRALVEAHLRAAPPAWDPDTVTR